MNLLEKSRNELVSKSKKDPKGLQRYKRRLKSRVASSVREFNRIDMNQFFKEDILTVNIKVRGETDNYNVGISFGGTLRYLKQYSKHRDNGVELRDIIRALISAFNNNDVFVNCQCPDFKYRFGYWSTANDYKQGSPELRPSNITNPNDNIGSVCKHSLLVLSNTSWLIKVASVIKNYIEYMEKNMQSAYADIIYPAVYGKRYEKPVQQSLFDTDELSSEESDIDKANIEARKKGQFKAGNEYRYQKPEISKDQLTLDDISTEVEDNE